jgi:hypothetical protein
LREARGGAACVRHLCPRAVVRWRMPGAMTYSTPTAACVDQVGDLWRRVGGGCERCRREQVRLEVLSPSRALPPAALRV